MVSCYLPHIAGSSVSYITMKGADRHTLYYNAWELDRGPGEALHLCQRRREERKRKKACPPLTFLFSVHSKHTATNNNEVFRFSNRHMKVSPLCCFVAWFMDNSYN